MVERKSWEEFRETGLLFFINQVLHAFGWSIVVELDKDTGEITSCYPARVKFRGFAESSVEKGYKKIGIYLKDNASELYNETKAEEELMNL